MSFLYPQFLWAFSLISIPIIIHFFSFKKVKIVRFSSLQFLKQVEEKTKNKRRLKHLLILISRIAFIVFLVIAFAQPNFKNDSIQKTKTIIFLDNSYSMTNEIAEGQSALNEAIIYTQSLIEKSSINHQYKLITRDNYSLSKSWRSKQQVIEELSQIAVTNKGFDFQSFLEEINNQETTDFSLIILSDFQHSEFIILQDEIPSIELVLVPFNYRISSNAFIDSAYLRSGSFVTGNQNILEIIVSNSGKEKINDLQIKLTSETDLINSSNIDIEGKSRKQISLELDETNIKNGNIVIQLNDFPVLFDNLYYVSIPKYKKPRISIIKPSNTFQSYFTKVYANNDLFESKEMSIDVPDFSYVQNSDILILDQIEYIPDWVTSIIDKDILVVPSVDIKEADIDKLFSSKIRKVKYDQSKLLIEDLNSPFIVGVLKESNSENLDMPFATINWEIMDPTFTILSNSFNRPFLSVEKTKNDKYLIATPFNNGETNFFKHALFVPLMYRIAQLSNMNGASIGYNFEKSSISLPISLDQRYESVSIVGNENRYFPEFRINGDILTLFLPMIDIEPGHYSVLADSDTVGNISLNRTTSESNLDQLEMDLLQKIANSSQNIAIADSNSLYELKAGLANNDSSLPLWKISLLISLLFIIVEVLLIRLLK